MQNLKILNKKVGETKGYTNKREWFAGINKDGNSDVENYHTKVMILIN